MALRNGDRAKETAAAPGTGQVTLGGAVTGFIAFSAIPSMANGDTVYYTITNGAALWEVGLGTYVSAGNKLSRTQILASSNAGGAVNFTGGVTLWGDRPAVMDTLPTQQVLTSGIGATYTTPPNCRQLRIRMVGGGGGGGGSGNSGATQGGDGGDTLFNAIHAAGGKGGNSSGIGGAGGAAGTGTANVRMAGGSGQSALVLDSSNTSIGISGGSSAFGGAGTNAIAGAANTGGGGGAPGGTGGGTIQTGAGGGGGEYVELIINNPAATYNFTIGSGGTAGSAGGAGAAGGPGGSGIIIVDEIYGS